MPKSINQEKCEKCKAIQYGMCACGWKKFPLEEKIEKGAEDFNNRFIGVMKDLGKPTPEPKKCELDKYGGCMVNHVCPIPKNESLEDEADIANSYYWKGYEVAHQETLKKLRQEIEGMKKEVKNYWDADALYNQALDNILKILEE